MILPKHQQILSSLGNKLRLARLRRHFFAAQVSQRAKIIAEIEFYAKTGLALAPFDGHLAGNTYLGEPPSLAECQRATDSRRVDPGNG